MYRTSNKHLLQAVSLPFLFRMMCRTRIFRIYSFYSPVSLMRNFLDPSKLRALTGLLLSSPVPTPAMPVLSRNDLISVLAAIHEVAVLPVVMTALADAPCVVRVKYDAQITPLSHSPVLEAG